MEGENKVSLRRFLADQTIEFTPPESPNTNTAASPVLKPGPVSSWVKMHSQQDGSQPVFLFLQNWTRVVLAVNWERFVRH